MSEHQEAETVCVGTVPRPRAFVIEDYDTKSDPEPFYYTVDADPYIKSLQREIVKLRRELAAAKGESNE